MTKFMETHEWQWSIQDETELICYWFTLVLPVNVILKRRMKDYKLTILYEMDRIWRAFRKTIREKFWRVLYYLRLLWKGEVRQGMQGTRTTNEFDINQYRVVREGRNISEWLEVRTKEIRHMYNIFDFDCSTTKLWNVFQNCDEYLHAIYDITIEVWAYGICVIYVM